MALIDDNLAVVIEEVTNDWVDDHYKIKQNAFVKYFQSFVVVNLSNKIHCRCSVFIHDRSGVDEPKRVSDENIDDGCVSYAKKNIVV